MYKTKDWTEFTAESSWRMFKIMAEFVEGFERMDKIGPCVSIYGSARTDPANPYYPLAEKLAARNGAGGLVSLPVVARVSWKLPIKAHIP